MFSPSRRTLIVLATLLGSMTLASAMLLVLEPGPSRVMARAQDAASLTLAVTDAPAGEPDAALFSTQPRPDPARWTSLIVHASGTPRDSALSLHQRHLEAGLGGLAYHFVIGNGSLTSDGQIEVGPRWRHQLPGYGNEALDPADRQPEPSPTVIHVCLVGKLDREPPTEAQLQELVWLVRTLQRRLSIDARNVHTDDAGARLFPEAMFRQQLLSF